MFFLTIDKYAITELAIERELAVVYYREDIIMIIVCRVIRESGKGEEFVFVFTKIDLLPQKHKLIN